MLLKLLVHHRIIFGASSLQEEREFADQDKVTSTISELPVPDVVKNASRAMEMARVWLVDNDQHVVLSPNLWKDPSAWGLMLVDLARHVANAYEAQGHDRAKTLDRIYEAFQAEWSHPTDGS